MTLCSGLNARALAENRVFLHKLTHSLTPNRYTLYRMHNPHHIIQQQHALDHLHPRYTKTTCSSNRAVNEPIFKLSPHLSNPCNDRLAISDDDLNQRGVLLHSEIKRLRNLTVISRTLEEDNNNLTTCRETGRWWFSQNLMELFNARSNKNPLNLITDETQSGRYGSNSWRRWSICFPKLS